MKYETPEMEIIFMDQIDDIITESPYTPALVDLFNAEGGVITI